MPIIKSSMLRRKVLTGAATAVVAAAVGIVTAASPAQAAAATVYASPSGTGTACSSAQPCSLAGAQAAVRSLNDAMSGDIVVQLADGVYRLPAPLRLTAEDSGTNGYSVVWQAAPSARPAISGARAVTGWTQADAGRNIWRAEVGSRDRHPAALRQRRRRHPGPHAVNRSDFTATSTGLRFSNGALSYLNNLANQSRIQMESVGSFTDRYVSVQGISGNFITMQQPGWNNNTFGYDTFIQPAPGRSAVPHQRVRVPRLARRVVSQSAAPARCTTSRRPGRT